MSHDLSELTNRALTDENRKQLPFTLRGPKACTKILARIHPQMHNALMQRTVLDTYNSNDFSRLPKSGARSSAKQTRMDKFGKRVRSTTVSLASQILEKAMKSSIDQDAPGTYSEDTIVNAAKSLLKKSEENQKDRFVNVDLLKSDQSELKLSFSFFCANALVGNLSMDKTDSFVAPNHIGHFLGTSSNYPLIIIDPPQVKNNVV